MQRMSRKQVRWIVDDLFADNESESDDDFGFDFGDISSDDE